tara:strand:- start:15 stop:710 length:696 start_codon:yes stop_codon:yes gene_type:complete
MLPVESRQKIPQLRQLNLQLSFPGRCVLSEDIENQLRSINNFQFSLGADGSHLSRSQVTPEHDDLGLQLKSLKHDLFQSPTAEDITMIRGFPALNLFSDNSETRRACELSQFTQHAFRRWLSRELHMNEHGSLRMRVIHNTRRWYCALEAILKIRNKDAKVRLDISQSAWLQQNMWIAIFSIGGNMSHLDIRKNTIGSGRKRKTQIEPQPHQIHEVVARQGIPGHSCDDPA